MTDEKPLKQVLLLPVSTPPEISRRPAWRVWRLAWLLLAVFLWGLHINPRTSEGNSRETTESQRSGRRPFGRRAEEAFLSVPNASSAIRASRLFATKPHLAGTPQDLTTAVDFLQILQREFNITPPAVEPIFPAGSSESQHATRSISKAIRPYAWIDTYYPVMNTPLDRNLQILDEDGTLLWEANLVEVSDLTDPDAGQYFDAVPTFHGLSREGDVTGKLVGGNYCTQDDYGKLVEKGVDLSGAIVLCRYGGIFRGLKVKGGQDLGAAGVLIYSDPIDDGTITVENGYLAYPNGPARNPTSVQRGSVQFISVYPGDPTTPGYPSYENSTRTEGANIPLIPSLPISWDNARTLFRTLQSDDPFGGKLVRLVNNVNSTVTPIWNTMGVIPGFIKDEVVVVGNHRDAWVLGATDPSSGTASVNEVIRGLGHLLSKGWRPLRTIVIASWDAEEYGLIGSTEWGEDFADWIDEHVVAYLNLDSSVSGSRFRMSGSPLLAHFIRDTAEEIPHPTDSDRTLWDATQDDGPLFGPARVDHSALNEEALKIREMEVAAADNVGVSPLGSGSDYTVFLQRNGIPSTNGGFGATLHDPVYHYHSVFDSERWQEMYGDPGFFRHIAVAKHLGLQTLRLGSSLALPFNTTHYAYELESYLETVQGIADQASLDVNFKPLKNSIQAVQKASQALEEEKQAALKDLQKIIDDWKKRHQRRRWLARTLKKVACSVKNALGHECLCQHGKPHRRSEAVLQKQDADEDEILVGVLLHKGNEGLLDHDSTGTLHPRRRFPVKRLIRVLKRIRSVNKKSSSFERAFISEDGIKDREWYKHLGVAPGKWLGYGATTFPALTEAITFEKNATLANYEVERLEKLLDKLEKRLKV
ncbi:unnamed protein product [Cyclocybe aegerita]|uniref:Zn-dependent exopeptidase n=1 Tax=Cyclocybe aegerita TaxID=1973307 RepID=A0A8S0WDB9_CYCAE|nr:unnamed protein product [Cyclocybe aegerita]